MAVLTTSTRRSDMAKYLVNAISLSMFEVTDDTAGIGLFTKKLTLQEFCSEARDAISAIGHQATADFVNALCSTNIQANRISIKLNDKDELTVIQVKERLPEGKTLTREELQQLIEAGKVEFIKLRVRYSNKKTTRCTGFANNVDSFAEVCHDRVTLGYWGWGFESEALVFDLPPVER